VSVTALSSALAIVAYLLTALLLFRRLKRATTVAHARSWRLALAAGLALHVLTLSLHLSELHSFDFSLLSAVSLVACVMGLIVLALSLRASVGDLALLLLPFLTLSVVLHAVLPAPTRQPDTLSWQIGLHVLIAIAAYSALALAALKVILIAFHDRLLRNPRRLAQFGALPPLSEAERLLFELIAVGFALLTLTLLTGALFVENLLAQHLVHKTAFSVLAWLIFGGLLFGRYRYGWRGKRALRWTLLGMGSLALAFLGSKFVLEVLLGRV